MPFPNESIDDFSKREDRFDNLKQHTPVGIFGSFYGSRKSDLISLQQFLQDSGYHARISENLDTRGKKDRKKKDPVYDRELSETLIMESDIHIFVLVLPKEGEPENLIQSVSMEIERLHTLDSCGHTSADYVAIYAEKGLIGTMGAVCEGLLLSKEGDWEIEEFEEIHEIFKPARQFCLNCILDRYTF